MTQIVSFQGYTPAARFDGVAWTQAKVEEAPTATGSWTLIDTLALSPVDADPTNPATRNLTTALASSTPDLWYRLTFVDAGGGVSLPTDPVQNSDSLASSLYITRDELKTALTLTGQSYADADIDRAVVAASRAIDEAVRSGGSHFYQATETRYYTPDDYNSYAYYSGFYGREHRLEIDDCVSVTSLTVDTAGDGGYATTWVEGTDFFLDPANANTSGKPFEEIVLRAQGGRYYPRIQRAVKVTGVFGWPVLPPEVPQYALIFATQLVLRSRQAPFGILMAGMEVGAAARISRFDPDFDRLLGSYVRPKMFL